MAEIKTNTIIIGASSAGLACAACLKKHEVPYILLEQHSFVGHSWSNHYDRLHLNTEKKYSSLPYLPFPKDAPTYISRDQVVLYLQEYARKLKLEPEFNQQVISIEHSPGSWQVTTTNKQYSANHLIMATGLNRRPSRPYWPGMETFGGTIIHSSEYKNGNPFKGQQVLVVGFGNSACEISICLHEHGAYPSLSVKNAVNIIPRGNGSTRVSSLMHSLAWISKLTPGLIDSINAPSLRARYGDYNTYGLRKLPYGPLVQMVKHKRVPLLDIGTFDLIKKGIIGVFPGIERFDNNEVFFTDGRVQVFDAVILGTGYRTALDDFFSSSDLITDAEGRPFKSGVESALPGLYFCGFSISPLGMLREIGREAKKIAYSIRRGLK